MMLLRTILQDRRQIAEQCALVDHRVHLLAVADHECEGWREVPAAENCARPEELVNDDLRLDCENARPRTTTPLKRECQGAL